MSHRISALLFCAALVAACTSDANPTAAAGAAGAAQPRIDPLDHKAPTKVNGIIMPIDSRATPTKLNGAVMPLDNKATQTKLNGAVMPIESAPTSPRSTGS